MQGGIGYRCTCLLPPRVRVYKQLRSALHYTTRHGNIPRHTPLVLVDTLPLPKRAHRRVPSCAQAMRREILTSGSKRLLAQAIPTEAGINADGGSRAPVEVPTSIPLAIPTTVPITIHISLPTARTTEISAATLTATPTSTTMAIPTEIPTAAQTAIPMGLSTAIVMAKQTYYRWQ